VLDGALRDDFDRCRTRWPRLRAMAAFAASLGEFDELYRKLAK
jgi:hypothetical protein